MSKRENYKCPTCGGTRFLQIVKEEHDRIYDSEEHVIERICGMSVGGEWSCTKCETAIPLKIIHGMFRGVEFRGFILLDIAEKIKDLEKFRKERIGE
jgi:hypothetical protein